MWANILSGSLLTKVLLENKAVQFYFYVECFPQETNLLAGVYFLPLVCDMHSNSYSTVLI